MYNIMNFSGRNELIMSEALALEEFDVDIDIQTEAHEEPEIMDTEELRKIARGIIAKHRKAFEALANA